MPDDSCFECGRYLDGTFEKCITSKQVTYCEIKDLMVMEQSVNVAEKELVPLVQEKRFKTLMWADGYVFAHLPVPRWISETSGRVSGSLSGGVAGAGLPGSPRYSSGAGNKSG